MNDSNRVVLLFVAGISIALLQTVVFCQQIDNSYKTFDKDGHAFRMEITGVTAGPRGELMSIGKGYALTEDNEGVRLITSGDIVEVSAKRIVLKVGGDTKEFLIDGSTTICGDNSPIVPWTSLKVGEGAAVKSLIDGGQAKSIRQGLARMPLGKGEKLWDCSVKGTAAQQATPAPRAKASPPSVPVARVAPTQDLALERELALHPERTDELVPKIEALILKQIRTTGPGQRFVIGEVEADTQAGASAVTVSDAGSVLKFSTEFPTDTMETNVKGDGSILRFKGRVETKVGGFIGFASEDDKSNRLTFAIVAKVGFVYVRGRGAAIKRDGTEVPLGQPKGK